MFSKKVDMRSRKAMVEFLTNHFRYNTMNSWNNSTSYAHCVKLWNLGLNKEQEDKFWELLNCDYSDFNGCYIEPLIEGFEEDTGYTAGFNGRSGGYLVMYDFEWKELDYKSRCTNCGQLNFTKIEENSCKCGRCGEMTRVNLTRPIRQKSIFPGRSIDQNEDFEDWDLESIRNRVKLVQRFDQLCDDIRSELIYYLDTHQMVEEEYTEVKTRKVFEEIA